MAVMYDISKLSSAVRGKGPRISAFEKPSNEGTVGSIPLENPRLNDKDNLELDIKPKDWKVNELDQPEEARKITKFIQQQFDSAQRARTDMELEWALATAFFEGRQWLRISSQGRNIIRLQNPNEPNRYMTVNKLRPLIDGVVGKLTQCAPDATAVPLSDSPQDRAASDEANFIAKHYNRKFGRETQTKERVRWACVCGTSFLKVFWDSRKTQVVPQLDVDGQSVVGHVEMRVGDVVEQILPAFDVYVDPSAKRDDDIRWMIHAMIKPLSWFVDSYGEVGKKVEADAMTGQYSGYVDAYLDGANAGGRGWVPPASAHLNSTEKRKNAAVVYEYWEKPSKLYPNGRYIVATQATLLYAGPWPYNKKDSFPFIPLRWQPRAGTPYGYSLGFDLVSLQSTYNRIYSRLLEQFEAQKDYLLIERLSSVGADAYDKESDTVEDKNRIYRKVYYDRGSRPPAVQRAPGIGSDLFPLLQMIEKDMMDVAGLHDVSQGMAQAGTPAESVRLLQKADNTQHSYVRADIEISNACIKEWEVSLIEQFAIVPFIGNIEGGMLPRDQIQQGVMRFDALRNGGRYRIVYVPGSSMDEGPDQRLNKYSALRQMGVFGDPMDPATNRLFVQLVNMPETTKILDHLDEQEAKMAEAQQQQMMMQQQAQAAQQGEQAQIMQFNMQIEQAKAQIEIEKTKAEIAAKLEADIALATAKAGLEAQSNEDYAMVDIGKQFAMNDLGPESGMNQNEGV
jgi:hypothetical protein